tara:strand:- start:111 stop:299 length:189 start_codon:yes stop_codon:yes gene_type:complete
MNNRKRNIGINAHLHSLLNFDKKKYDSTSRSRKKKTNYGHLYVIEFIRFHDRLIQENKKGDE